MIPPSRSLLPFVLTLLTLLIRTVSAEVVINEIHYNPPANPVRQEFIELYNPGASVVVLSGWRLSGAVTYAFPNGTSIPANGYLVIAEHPPTLLATLGAVAIGPYAGQLASEGETVRLRGPDDAIIDEVDYKVGFPWPVAANGEGPSIELINPTLDNELGSSWRASQVPPTPGTQNSVFAANAAPNIRKVLHTPNQPTATDPVVITALVTDPEGVANVTLEYQVVAPGAYIPSHLPLPISGNNINPLVPRSANPAYASGWTSVPMLDNGTGGDLLAGDGIFTVTLPPQAHRTLLRYRITVEDGLGLTARVPYPDDTSLNFACFIYNGVPDYNGHPSATLQTLPVYHLLTRAADYSQCFAYDSADRINQGSEARFFYNWSGTIVYDGVVYDNISYRLRGANGRYHMQGKRSMRFRMNDGYYFQARDQMGKEYPKKWRTLTTGKGFDNRGTLTFSLNEALSMYLFNKMGVPAANTHWIHWRVIDGAAEAPDQWRGDFHGLNFVIETYDVRFLDSHNLEKGNLYKLINQTNDWQQQQRYQSRFAPSDGSDHNFIENSLDGYSGSRVIKAVVNLDRWNRWHALAEATRIYDFWPSSNKNMVYYFEPEYTRENGNRGKLWILPWDTDASWGPTWNNGHDVVYNALFPASGGGSDSGSTPTLWPDYFNTVREMRDLLWQPNQIEPLINEFSAFIAPFESADADRWKNAPNDAGNYTGLGGAGALSRRALVQDMKDFAFVGGSWPGGTVGAGGRAAFLDTLQASNGQGTQIPATPTITYTGTAGYPTDGLAFQSSAFSDPQGAATFGAMEWRIAAITDPTAPAHDPTERFKLEWEADWESGALSTFGATLVTPTTAVRSGLTYRARVRHKDTGGYWSHWSAPVEFTTTLPDISSYLGGLVISEIMYHPTDPTAAEFEAGFTDDDDFEFIELRNVGPVALNLTDLRFTKGVDFDFLGADITALAPGAYVLIVSNRAAFEMRYGTGLPVAGEWDPTDKLDNGGERIKLSFGAGDTIRDFIYDDVAPWPIEPDGAGPSLTLIDPLSVPDHGLPANWQASSGPQGSPGTDDLTGSFADWMAAQGATDPDAPFGSSSLSNLLAFTVGADLTPTPEAARPTLVIVDDGTTYPALRFRVRQDLGEVTYLVEVSEDLLVWQGGGAFTTQFGAPVDNGDGTLTFTIRSLQSLDSRPHQFLRLRPSLPDTSPFAAWMTARGATDPDAPFGPSSMSNLLAYAVGADLTPTPEAALPTLAIVDDGGTAYPALRYRLRQDAVEITYLVEISDDLVLWQSGEAFTTQVGAPVDNGDGTLTLTMRSLQSVASKPNQYLRLRVALPGTSPFATWMTARGATDPDAPFGSSSLSNLLAYAVGADLTPTPEAALPTVAIVDDGGTSYPALRYRLRQGAAEITYLVEVSEDLDLWKSGESFTTQFGSPEDNGDGTLTFTIRSLQSLASKPNQYLRLRVGFTP